MYHSKACLVDAYRDPALETNVTTTVTGAATWDPVFEPDPKSDGPSEFRTRNYNIATLATLVYGVMPSLMWEILYIPHGTTKRVSRPMDDAIMI